MSVEQPYWVRYIIHRRDFDQWQYHKEERKSPKIEDKHLLMLGESSEFLSESWNPFRKIKFFVHLKIEKLKDNLDHQFRNT